MSSLGRNESHEFYSHPEAVGEAADSVARRQVCLENLKARIRRIEGGALLEEAAGGLVRHGAVDGAWTFGVTDIDRWLGEGGLDPAGVHEIGGAPAVAGVSAAAAMATRRTFALLLAVRRLRALLRPAPLLWCLPQAAIHEAGMPYSRGLGELGLAPDAFVVVRPRRSQDVLWVVEEALKAGCLSLVVGEVAAMTGTAARRLSLAAAQSGTPCLLVPSGAGGVLAATATRWRVAPRPSAPDALDPAAPGRRGFAISLERCRARPVVSGAVEFAVEWCDATGRFHLAAAFPDRAPASRPALAEQVRPRLQGRLSA